MTNQKCIISKAMSHVGKTCVAKRFFSVWTIYLFPLAKYQLYRLRGVGLYTGWRKKTSRTFAWRYATE